LTEEPFLADHCATSESIHTWDRLTGRHDLLGLHAETRVGELELTTRRQLVRTLVAMIKQLNEQIKELERQITTAIREHPDGEIFLSLFKGSVITAAELLAEIGDCRARIAMRSRATPVMSRSRSSQANAKQRAFAGGATSGFAKRSASSRTAPATGTPGHKRCTPTR
jgi:transposase